MATEPTSVPQAVGAIEDPSGVEWDVVVIGAGMGGGTAGYELARRGLRVLFLEKGRFLQRDPDALTGELVDQSDAPSHRLARGYWPFPLQGVVRVDREVRSFQTALSAGEIEFFAPLGCGTGGSTTLYGATLERFFPSDFEPRQHFPESPGSTLPERWPVSFAEMEPYYARAERLFGVCGTSDPLHPDSGADLADPPPLNDRDREAFELLADRGLHPYRLHVGCAFRPGCEGCGGRLCLRACKSDAGWVCIVPALDRYGATLLSECDVVELLAGPSRVEAAVCHWRGRELRIRAKTFVLAAGALMTPMLLLTSKSSAWPEGLANRSSLVGRNLMVHAGDVIAIRPLGTGRSSGFNKSLSFNDFYFIEGRKVGNVQSVGVPVDTGSVFAHIQQTMSKAPSWLRRAIPQKVLRLAARIGAYYFRDAVVFGAIVEDLPYSENRVLLDSSVPNGMRFEYRYTSELHERSELLREELERRIGKRHALTLTRSLNLNFGHPCGTCRFGNSPEESVLDRNNKAHGVENLYVVDASFFPSSSGTNPSLTIAANAIRVAEHIVNARGLS